jgi:hypothetical protein
MNSNNSLNTNDTLCDYYKKAPNDYLKLSIKIIGLVIHLIYFLLAICFKKMRTKQLVFLNNLNIIGIMILVYSLFRELNLCVTDLTCAIEALGLFLSISYKSYSITLLLSYRMICILTDKVFKILKWKIICIIFTCFYIFVFLLNVGIYFNTGNRISFLSDYNRCVVLSRDGLFVYLMLVFNNMIPSLFSFCGAIWIIVKLRAQSSMFISNSNNLDASIIRKKIIAFNQSGFNLSWQIIVFTISFQIFTISNLLIIYDASLNEALLTKDIVTILTYARWSAFTIDSLALYFFSPLIKNYFKKLWN